MKNLLILTVFVTFTVIMFVGCGENGTSALVGNWLLEDGQDYSNMPEYYKLEKNGSGIAGIKDVISWKIENKRFSYVFESSSIAYVFDYKISGKTLTITHDDGKSYRYIKTIAEDNSYKKWRSMIDIDPITDNKNIYFRVRSSTNDRRYLFIRRLNGELEMFINWNIEIDSSTDVTFRIDDKEPETKSWSLSTNKRSLFYPNNSLMPLIVSLLDAEKVPVRCIPNNQGILTDVFDVTGFREMVTKYNQELKWLNEDPE